MPHSNTADNLLLTSQRKPIPRVNFLDCKLPTYLQSKLPLLPSPTHIRVKEASHLLTLAFKISLPSIDDL